MLSMGVLARFTTLKQKPRLSERILRDRKVVNRFFGRTSVFLDPIALSNLEKSHFLVGHRPSQVSDVHPEANLSRWCQFIDISDHVNREVALDGGSKPLPGGFEKVWNYSELRRG